MTQGRKNFTAGKRIHQEKSGIIFSVGNPSEKSLVAGLLSLVKWVKK
jgi:hypothetical protein